MTLTRISLFLFAAMFMGGCDHSHNTSGNVADAHQTEGTASKQQFFGAQFDPAGAVPVTEVAKMLEGKESVQVKFTSTIQATCTKKGCWMDVSSGTADNMKVKMKDYAFFVPTKGCENKTCVVSGIATKELISVDDLKHYAGDAGKPQAEIDAITQPKEEISFMADGIMIEGL
jgi:Domain of unknown function (DUF4920)